MYETVGTGIVVAVITLLIRDGVPAVITLFKSRSEIKIAESNDERQSRLSDIAERRKDESIAVKELKELVHRQSGEIDSLRLEIREQRHQNKDDLNTLTLKLLACEQRHARDGERILSLEDALTRHNIPFHKRNPEGSGAHKTLPPTDE